MGKKKKKVSNKKLQKLHTFLFLQLQHRKGILEQYMTNTTNKTKNKNQTCDLSLPVTQYTMKSKTTIFVKFYKDDLYISSAI